MTKKNKYKNVEIRMVTEWPEQDIINLYKTGGWWKKSDTTINLKKLIKGSYAFVLAIDQDNGKAVGMGRLLSDGVSDAYIQDLIVLPNYRGYGIGKRLTKKLIDVCLSQNISWIGLISEPGQSGFYNNLGFKCMKNYSPMRYYQKE
jgi:ribosomal protein S18 acetylase RimI-like enzyme